MRMSSNSRNSDSFGRENPELMMNTSVYEGQIERVMRETLTKGISDTAKQLQNYNIISDSSQFDKEKFSKMVDEKADIKLDKAYVILRESAPTGTIQAFEKRLKEREEMREKKLTAVKEKIERLGLMQQEEECIALQQKMAEGMEKAHIRFPEDAEFIRLTGEVEKASKHCELELRRVTELNKKMELELVGGMRD